MNIFIISECPVTAAQMQCDMHVVKMTLETAQILCAPFPKGEAPYKRTHYGHPCTVWARESFGNYQWLYKHGMALAEEYTYRFGKRHKSQDVIEWCMKNVGKLQFQKSRRTEFVMAMPAQYRRRSDPVEAYRAYYLGEKMGFAKWNKGREEPYWTTKNPCKEIKL